MRRALLAAMLAQTPVWAAGSALGEQSAVAGGTAGAGTARPGDPSAAWYNPAALADGGGWRFGAGALMAVPALAAAGTAEPWSADTESGLSAAPHVYASYARNVHAFGVAVGVPHGGGSTWPSDWPGRFELVKSKLQVFRVSPFLSRRIGPVRFGGGFHIDIASLRILQARDFVDVEGEAEIALSGVGWGMDASLFWEAFPWLDVGLSYKGRTKLSLTGDADFSTPEEFSSRAQDQGVSTQMTLPHRFALGTRWHHGKWAALADLEVTLWAANKQQVLDFEQEDPDDSIQQNDWNNTVSGRLGAEYFFRPLWIARAGFLVDPSPVPSNRLKPSSPDSTRIGGTLGIGRKIWREIAVDVFYAYLHFLSRASQNEEALAARYGGRLQLIGVELSYKR